MSKVFVSVGMSLDGFMAPEHRTDAQWMKQWMQLQDWLFHQATMRRMLKLGEGGETGHDDRRVQETFARSGASVMGKRMFDAGEHAWPEEAPFHTPVFVVTHEVRSPWERPGGTVFHFVNDGVESALRQARAAAGDREVRIAGGADLIRQCLTAGWVDELNLALAPVVLGAGLPLLAGLDPERVRLHVVSATHSPRVTHLRYAVRHPD